jgi:hypothetical protein
MEAPKSEPNEVHTIVGRRGGMLALLSQVERLTFQPKFQVSNDAVLIAQSLSRHPI